MPLKQRLRPAGFAASKHLLASVFVAICCAGLVFGLWYPQPFGDLAGGEGLFFLLISVDVICGPLLTLIVFNPRKPTAELWRDIGVVVVLQLAALLYGLNSTLQARPVYLAYEGDRFRIVSLPDIDQKNISQAPPELQNFGYSGPRVIGVILLQPADSGYLESLEAALKGEHPAFRPSRWVAYDKQRQDVLAAAKPLAQLRGKNTERAIVLDDWIKKSGISERDVAYLPLASSNGSDWVVIVQRKDATPIAYLPLDGW